MGRVQLRRIASATVTRIVEAWLIFCFSSSAMNFSKSSMVTRPAAPLPATPARSAALNPSSVMRALSRGERKLAPAALAGTGKPRTVGCTRLRVPLPFAPGETIGIAGFGGRRDVQTQTRRFFPGGFDAAQRRTHGVAFIQLNRESIEAPAAGRGHGHARLVRLNFDQILAGFHGVTRLDQKADDVGLGDGFAQLGHDDGNLRHGF